MSVHYRSLAEDPNQGSELSYYQAAIPLKRSYKKVSGIKHVFRYVKLKLNLYILGIEVCNYLCLPWFFLLEILKTVFLCGSSKRLKPLSGHRLTAGQKHLGKSVKPTSERLQILHHTWLTQTLTILGNFNLEFTTVPTHFQPKSSLSTWARLRLLLQLIKDKWVTEKQEQIKTTYKWKDFLILIVRNCNDLR